MHGVRLSPYYKRAASQHDRHMTNSSHGQLVKKSTRHSQLVTRPTRHTVNSLHCISQLVAQSQATRHKLTHTSKLTWHFPRNIDWLYTKGVVFYFKLITLYFFPFLFSFFKILLLFFTLLLHVCCIYANKDTGIYSSYVRRGVFSGVLQSESLTSNALTQNTSTRLAVIDTLFGGHRAVPLQTITTRHSNRKQTTDRTAIA